MYGCCMKVPRHQGKLQFVSGTALDSVFGKHQKYEVLDLCSHYADARAPGKAAVCIWDGLGQCLWNA